MPLQFVLTREPTTSKGTAGVFQILVDGKEVAKFYSLEDPVRDVKVWGDTAIPKGTYNIVASLSNRFKKVLPEVQNVQGFAGVRIHGGNTKEDSHGCVLVGMRKDSEARISNCQPAVNLILDYLHTHKSGKLTIKDKTP